MRELDGTVLRSMNAERTREIMATAEGQGMLQMLMAEWPWDVFVTLTTTEVCSPERMKKIIFKTFGMNRITIRMLMLPQQGPVTGINSNNMVFCMCN